jgi:hypothetical protein
MWFIMSLVVVCLFREAAGPPPHVTIITRLMEFCARANFGIKVGANLERSLPGSDATVAGFPCLSRSCVYISAVPRPWAQVGHFDVTNAPGRSGQPVYTASLHFCAASLGHLRILLEPLLRLSFSVRRCLSP